MRPRAEEHWRLDLAALLFITVADGASRRGGPPPRSSRGATETMSMSSPASIWRRVASPAVPRRSGAQIQARRGRRPGGSRQRRGEEWTAPQFDDRPRPAAPRRRPSFPWLPGRHEPVTARALQLPLRAPPPFSTLAVLPPFPSGNGSISLFLGQCEDVVRAAAVLRRGGRRSSPQHRRVNVRCRHEQGRTMKLPSTPTVGEAGRRVSSLDGMRRRSGGEGATAASESAARPSSLCCDGMQEMRGDTD
jgi:hypothetical protein